MAAGPAVIRQTFSVEIPGEAEPQGSKTTLRDKQGRPKLSPKSGLPIMIEDNPDLRPWRRVMTGHMLVAKGRNWQPLDGPLLLEVTFRFARPKSHFGTGRNAGKLKPSAPHWKKTRPDTSKLLRAVEDSLQAAGVITEDSRIVHPSPWKVYVEPGEKPGVTIMLCELEEPVRHQLAA